MKDSKLGVFSI